MTEQNLEVLPAETLPVQATVVTDERLVAGAILAAQAEREEAERFYKQGLSDYVTGRRDTPAALAYIEYWASRAS